MGRNFSPSYNARFIGEFTVDTLPDAISLADHSLAYVYGRGYYYVSGSNWVSENDIILPDNSSRPMSYILSQSAVPRILLSSATAVTATGAITGLTALPYVPSGVVIVYFQGLAIGAQNALYYARFSSTTACQLYETVASNPEVPGTTMPSGITAGAYAGTNAEVTLASVTVPGGAMGPNGKLTRAFSYAMSNTAGSKTLRDYLGGVQIGGSGTTTSTAATRYLKELTNRGDNAVQFSHGISASLEVTTQATGTGITNTQYSINTSVDKVYSASGTLATATDFIILESLTIEILPGA